MPYTDRILGPEERVLHRTRPHWIIFAWPLLALFASLAAMPFLDELFANHVPGSVIAVIAGIWLGVAWLEHRVEEHVVTNRRVISRWGIIRRDVYVYPLHRIDSIDVRQGLLGRLLGYGAVEIHTSSESHGTSGRRYIAKPEEWRRHILGAIDNLSGDGTEEREGDGGEADRLRKLGSLLDEGLISQEEYDRKRSEILRDI